ncbi:MAG: hypothetical protein HRT61_07015 [Ekhidna sp.]|nr:hypothetical protein [Ekhidna sp.]
MKTIFQIRAFLSIGMFCVLGLAMSQKVTVSTYVERTHISPKTGVFVGYKDRYSYEYGFFYQQATTMLMSKEKQQELPRFYEREFIGTYLSAPIYYLGDFTLKMNVRMGVSNEENFVITPAFLAHYSVFENVTLQAGLGARCFRPTYQYGISISL